MKIHRPVDYYIKILLGLGVFTLALLVGIMVGYSMVLPCRKTTALPTCMEYVNYEEKDGQVIETKIPERNENCDS